MKRSIMAGLLMLLTGCFEPKPTPEKNYIETGNRVCMFYGGLDRVLNFEYSATRYVTKDHYQVLCKDGSYITRAIDTWHR